MQSMILTLLTAVYGTTVLCSPLSGRDIRELLPSAQEFHNWIQTDSASIYTGEDLFTMINGGADIYLEYGFIRAVRAEYSTKTHTLTAEIYEMSSEASAFGIYSVSKSRSGIIISGKCEAQLNPMYILFYKSQYFGIISSGDSADISIKGMKDLFGIINNKIIPSCIKPRLADLLPRKGLKDIKLVHGYLGLSTIATFDTRDLFLSKQGVIGFYDSAEVFIFNYENENKSADIFSSLKKSFPVSDRFKGFTDHKTYFEMKNRKDDAITGTFIQNLVIIIQSRNRYDHLPVFTSIRLLMKEK